MNQERFDSLQILQACRQLVWESRNTITADERAAANAAIECAIDRVIRMRAEYRHGMQSGIWKSYVYGLCAWGKLCTHTTETFYCAVRCNGLHEDSANQNKETK